jgi:hypothetical protein
MSYIFKFLVLFFIIIFLNSCGLSDNSKFKAQRVIKNYIELKENLINSNKKFNIFKNSSNFNKYKSYANDENWSNKYIQANKKYKKSLQIVNDIEKLLDINDEEDEIFLNKKIIFLQEELNNIRNLYEYPFKTVKLIDNTKENLDDIFKKSNILIKDFDTIYFKLKDYLNKSILDYSNKKDYLKLQIKKLDDLKFSSNKNYLNIQKEYKNRLLNISYTSFAYSFNLISSNLKLIKNLDINITKRVSQLYQSYSKVLKDMKIDYYIVVGLSTWNSNSDFGERNFLYPEVKVDKNIYEYIINNDISNIARINGFFYSSLRIDIDKRIWNALKIPNLNLPYSHDSASFWIDKTFLKFYHKYRLIKNSSYQDTQFVEVDEKTFLQEESNLGLSILSKPYGLFEDEVITKATPVGLNMVGNSKYGKWSNKTDPNSGKSIRFWEYYMMYSFFNSMMGRGHYYSYNNWSNYNNNYRRFNKSYYGSNNEYGTWGRKTYQNSSYSSSSYARRNSSLVSNIRSGRVNQNSLKKSSSRSSLGLRSSSRSTRSRGPGGFGK